MTSDTQPITDCHVHVFDPERFPYAVKTDHTPRPNETAPVEVLNAVMDAHGVGRALIVTPTAGYGPDNAAARDAISRFPDRFRGIAVLGAETSPEELSDLHDAGFAGVRLNLLRQGASTLSESMHLVRALEDAGMVLQIQTDVADIGNLEKMLDTTSLPVVFDHMGRSDVSLGINNPDFRRFLKLAERDQTYVKLSGPFRFPGTTFPYHDVDAFAGEVLEEFGPQKCVWGSDWPFVRMDIRLDYGPTMVALERWCPHKDDRDTILSDTPERLFGFGGRHP